MSKVVGKPRAPRPRKIAPLPETTEGFPDVSTHEIRAETNPFTSADWRMLSYAWAGLLVRVLIVLGGIFTVYQYLDGREQGRVEKSLELVSLWEQPQYQEAQVDLRTRLDALNQRHANLLGPNPSETDLRVYYRRLGLEAMKPEGGDQPLPEFRDAFDRIVYFLNRLSFCVESALCSRSVADAFFMDFAVSFWGYFSGHVEQVRARGEANYAAPLQAYVENSKR